MSKVAVVGLGYVGLPMAALCAKKGHAVVGLERNLDIVASVNAGRSHFKDDKVQKLLDEVSGSSNFTVTADMAMASDCTIFIICVPTPIDTNLEPDLAPLLGAIECIAPNLKVDDLIIVESTVFPGVCEGLLMPEIELQTGLVVGVDLQLAHCPERVNPGDDFWTVENIPRVIGATSSSGVQLAAKFYSSILGGKIFDVKSIRSNLRPKFEKTADGFKSGEIPLGSVVVMNSIRDAEAVKAMENTVRDVNIAFVNELAKVSDVLGLNVVDIIDGMSSKPFGKGPFYPGIGVGGHCIAVDPEWLKSASIKAGYFPELIQLARSTNNSMPRYAVELLQDALNDCGLPISGTKIAILGVSYKKNVSDSRESPFYDVRNQLVTKGANLAIYDSWVEHENSASSILEAIKGATAIVIVTDHDDVVRTLTHIDLKACGVKVLIDGRNCVERKRVESQGIKYRGIGR
jgi:UDP-N-acetyl-D-glucosamine dehydrogenase